MHTNSRLIVAAFSALLALSCRCSADTANCLVLDPSGKPVANATVYQVVDGRAKPTTLTSDSMGHFSPTDSSGVQYVIDAPGFAPSGGILQVDGNTFTLSTPLSITGKVVDGSGKPVTGAVVKAGWAQKSRELVNGQSQGSCSFQIDPLKARYTVKTDSRGNYKIDDLPSNAAVSIELDDPKYVLQIKTAAPGRTTLSSLKAVPGATVTGKVVREDGKPVGIITVYDLPDPMPRDNYNASGALTLPDGSYTLTGLTPGRYSINIMMPHNGSSNDWVPPAPAPVVVSLGAANAAPTIVLSTGVIVTGSFLDADTKKPISGVHVDIRDSADWPNTKMIDLITGDDGSFTAHLWTGAATLEAYVVPNEYVNNPSTTKRTINGVAGAPSALDPILLQRKRTADGKPAPRTPPPAAAVTAPAVWTDTDGNVNGTVYNGLGKPVAGAWVYSPNSGIAGLPVQTDSAGGFTIAGLAVGPVKIYAAKGPYSVSLSAQATSSSTNTAIHLSSLPTPPLGVSNLTKATAMLSADLNNQATNQNFGEEGLASEAAHVIADVSPDAAIRFLLSYIPVSSVGLEAIISARLGVDPVGIANWAVVPMRRMSGDVMRSELAIEVGLAVAPYDKTAALPYYDMACKTISLKNLSGNSLAMAMGRVALAYALHEPEADDDYAKVSLAVNALTDKAKTDATTAFWLNQNAPDWVTSLAKGNPELAENLVKKLPVDAARTAVYEAILGLVKANPAAAVDFYQLFANLKEAPLPSWDQPDSLCTVLPTLYKTDPQSALAQARAIKISEVAIKALTILADLTPIATAAPIYEEAETDAPVTESNPMSPACVAYHAWLRDKTLGIKLYKEAFTKFNSNIITAAAPEHGPCSADFAFYYAPIDPAFSRMLIERRFLVDNNAKDNNAYYGDAIADCCAMASIDINRAGELAKSITDEKGRYIAGVKIAQYVLLTPQQRQQIPFTSWGRMSSWTPDSEVMGL